MDQQKCSAIVKHTIQCFSCLPLSQSYDLSLNRRWTKINHLINDRLLDA